MTRSTMRLLLLCALAWTTPSVTGCDRSTGGSGASASSAAAKPPSPVAVPAGASDHSGSWRIDKAGGGQLAKLDIIGPKATLEYGGHRLLAKVKKGARRYHLDGAEDYFGKIKFAEPNKFKLKDASGKLLWKVKISAEKIKISDNENNENPFEIKRKASDRFKLSRAEKALGSVRFDAAKHRLSVEDADGSEMYFVNAKKISAAYALLVLEGIPEPQRYALMAELRVRGH